VWGGRDVGAEIDGVVGCTGRSEMFSIVAYATDGVRGCSGSSDGPAVEVLVAFSIGCDTNDPTLWVSVRVSMYVFIAFETIVAV
jgi:hypothetical protein